MNPNDYINGTFSKERIGLAGLVPSVPCMPTACQVSKATGMLHIKLIGDSYVRAPLPSFHPASFQSIVQAIKACDIEPSWSGSPSQYYVLKVEPEAGGRYARLFAGDVLVGYVAVIPEAELVSADVSLEEQAKEAGGGHGKGDPSVN